MATLQQAEQTAALNDTFRRTMPCSSVPGRVVMTCGVAALPSDTVASILQAVCTFSAFTPGNDPHREHDFGAVTIGDVRCFWKIDYYENAACEFGAEDPSDVRASYRVLIIMLAEEY
jgi:Protein of unknown function (DUF3768)